MKSVKKTRLAQPEVLKTLRKRYKTTHRAPAGAKQRCVRGYTGGARWPTSFPRTFNTGGRVFWGNGGHRGQPGPQLDLEPAFEVAVPPGKLPLLQPRILTYRLPKDFAAVGSGWYLSQYRPKMTTGTVMRRATQITAFNSAAIIV